ncbi:MAG: protein-export chaperone SecB [Gammaproteobacteria bacterium]|nr:protein-export chaperone SecB [Gammaproteobacteria bacterium]NNF67511.1 protein-export chaperone SecB [Gammaproteobacteria bacterium]
MSEEQAAAAGSAEQKQIVIQKLYVKDISFEAPGTPEIFNKEWRPEVNLNLQTKNTLVGENLREVVLSVTAEAKLGETTAFLVEVHQAGVFLIAGFNEPETQQLIGAYCPNMLFPFAREAITDLVGKGGFPGLLLQPVNFEGLFAKQMEEMAKAKVESEATSDKH